MHSNHYTQHKRHVRRTGLVLGAALALGACAANTKAPSVSTSHIEIQEEVGFTITEEARVAGGSRAEYLEALNLLDQGWQEQGIEMLEKVATEAPELSAPRIDLGIAYHKAGNLEAAERNLKQALLLIPEHPIVHNELGIIYRKQGRFVESKKSYEAALAVYPGYHFARRNLAILCDLYLADLNCALENYEAYMTTVLRDDEATMWIADIRARLNH